VSPVKPLQGSWVPATGSLRALAAPTQRAGYTATC